jgi:hypothetical protein
MDNLRDISQNNERKIPSDWCMAQIPSPIYETSQPESYTRGESSEITVNVRNLLPATEKKKNPFVCTFTIQVLGLCNLKERMKEQETQCGTRK